MKNYSKISVFLLIICVFGDDVKIVSVKKGDSVTLNTDLTEFNHINWLFGDSYSFIAKFDGNVTSYPLNDTERFRDRLKMDNQTGSLTINNTRFTDSGLYHLQIDHDYMTSNKKFRVSVQGSFYLFLSPGPVAAIVVVVLLVLALVVCYCMICKQRMENDEEETESTKEDVINYKSAAAEDPNSRY